MNEPKPSGNRPTFFQIVIIGWLLLLTAIVGVGVVNLLRLQRAAEDSLAQAARQLTTLRDDHISYLVKIDQMVPVSTSVNINENIAVPISLTVAHTVRIDDAIPFEQDLVVPVEFEIDRQFPIVTTIPFSDTIELTISRFINIDSNDIEVPISIPGLGQYSLPIPIQARIPINFPVSIPISRTIPVNAQIPIKIPISETFTIAVSRTVPVQLDIPVNIPVETEVIVPISRTIPIQTDIPIAMDVPINIAIADTPFGDYLLDLSESLQQLAGDK
jgi:type II secretory pathway pseudopilin PulG